MISSLRPGDKALEESLSTLNYSKKAAYISNKPIKNQDPKVRLISELKREIRELTTELQKAQEHIELLTKLTEAKKEEIFRPLRTTAEISLPPSDKLQKDMSEIKPSLSIKLELDSQTQKLNDLTTGLMNGDKERIMDRLLQSVNMVKEVLQSNLKLRSQVQEMGDRLDQQNAEIFHLHSENDEQKEKIQILAGMNQEDVPEHIEINLPRVSEDIFKKRNPSFGNPLGSFCKVDVADEILQLKRQKTKLEQRVHYLEVENIHMRTETAQGKRLNEVGTDDFEPVRSVLNVSEMLPPRSNPQGSGFPSGRRNKKSIHDKKGGFPQDVTRTNYSKLRLTQKPENNVWARGTTDNTFTHHRGDCEKPQFSGTQRISDKNTRRIKQRSELRGISPKPTGPGFRSYTISSEEYAFGTQFPPQGNFSPKKTNEGSGYEYHGNMLLSSDIDHPRLPKARHIEYSSARRAHRKVQPLRGPNTLYFDRF